MIRRIVLVATLFAVGCGSGSKKTDANVVPYFDLSSHLRKHVQTMFRREAYLIKYVTYNGKSDQVVSRNPDWNKELNPFFEADIHTPSLIGVYTVDSTRMEDRSLKLDYKSNDADAAVKQLTLTLDSTGDLRALSAVRRTTSMLNDIQTTLTYERFDGFRVDVKETNKFSSDIVYTVAGEIHMGDAYFR